MASHGAGKARQFMKHHAGRAHGAMGSARRGMRRRVHSARDSIRERGQRVGRRMGERRAQMKDHFQKRYGEMQDMRRENREFVSGLADKFVKASQNAKEAMQAAGVAPVIVNQAMSELESAGSVRPRDVQQTLSGLGVSSDKIEAAVSRTRMNDRRSGITPQDASTPVAHGVASDTQHNDNRGNESIRENISFRPNMNVSVSINGEKVESAVSNADQPGQPKTIRPNENRTHENRTHENRTHENRTHENRTHESRQESKHERQESRPEKQESQTHPAQPAPAQPTPVQQFLAAPAQLAAQNLQQQRQQQWRATQAAWRDQWTQRRDQSLRRGMNNIASQMKTRRHTGMYVVMGLMVFALIMYCCNLLPLSVLFIGIVISIIYFMYRMFAHKAS